jgi:hypothetical protein
MGIIRLFFIKHLRGSDTAEGLIRTVLFLLFLGGIIFSRSGWILWLSFIGIGFIVDNIYHKIEKLNQEMTKLKDRSSDK